MSIAFPRMPEELGQPVAPVNVLFLGSCQVEPIANGAERAGHKAKHMLYESGVYANEIRVDLAEFDACFVGITLRHLLRDASGRWLASADMALAKLRDESEAAALLERCAEALHLELEKLHPVLGSKPTFFASFFRPSFNYAGNLVERFKLTSPHVFIGKVNEILYNKIQEWSNFYYIESNEILDYVGRMHLHDDIVMAASHAAFIGEFDVNLDRTRLQASISNYNTYSTPAYLDLYVRAVWKTMIDNLAIIRQKEPVKLVIVDLDDTLWRGVAAEENTEGWTYVEGWPGGFVEALLFLKRRGVLLAICSKNDREPTLARLAKIWCGGIAADDFASIKINWELKSDNIAEILSEVNLLPQNVLFIDDNPREIDEVRSRFPDMRFLSANHYDWRRVLLRSPETQFPVITDESQRRTELARARIEREESAKILPREQWLESLNIEERVVRVTKDTPAFERAFELINKTNQFNTTGKRWELGEFEEFIATGGVCLAASLKDKTIDNGIIGVAMVSPGQIVQTVLSCRVFGLGAEFVLGSIATQLALAGQSKVIAKIVDTGKNFACHRYFEDMGFVRVDDHFEASTPCEKPKWISVSAPD